MAQIKKILAWSAPTLRQKRNIGALPENLYFFIPLKQLKSAKHQKQKPSTINPTSR